MAIPAGFPFMPSDDELLSYLLHHKEMNGSCSYDFICEKQIYGDDATSSPWNLFDDSQTNWIESGSMKRKMTYVFSKPCKVGNSNSNKRINRVAGCGTWEGKSATLDLRDSECRVIGKKRQFGFKSREEFKESEAKGKGHWIMHELSLLDGYEYVVCRIIKDLSKQEMSMPAIIDDHQNKQEDQERIGEEEGQGRKRKMGEEEEDGNMMNPMKKAYCDQRIEEEFLATLFSDDFPPSFQGLPHLNPLSFSTMYQEYQDCIFD